MEEDKKVYKIQVIKVYRKELLVCAEDYDSAVDIAEEVCYTEKVNFTEDDFEGFFLDDEDNG